MCGLTGMAIITDISKGNFDLEKLSEYRHGHCRKSKEEIAKAPKGNNHEDYLFGLKEELESYQFYQKKIAACNKQIGMCLKNQINTNPDKKKLKTSDKIHVRIIKNALKGIDLNQAAYQYFGGVDLMKIECGQCNRKSKRYPPFQLLQQGLLPQRKNRSRMYNRP